MASESIRFIVYDCTIYGLSLLLLIGPILVMPVLLTPLFGFHNSPKTINTASLPLKMFLFGNLIGLSGFLPHLVAESLFGAMIGFTI